MRDQDVRAGRGIARDGGSVRGRAHVVRHSELLRVGEDPKPHQRAVRSGSEIAVAPGVYVSSSEWTAMRGLEQHRLRVLAEAPRLTAAVVYSHFAAAALHGIRLLGPWPGRVDVCVSMRGGGRSSGMVRRHNRELPAESLVMIDGLVATSVAVTVMDLACVLPFRDAVCMIDDARSKARPGGPLVGLDELRDVLESLAGAPGVRRARAALMFSTDESGSILESLSRVIIDEFGFTAPVLQQRLDGDLGTYFGDFWWPDVSVWAEYDGDGKYGDPEFLRGRTPKQALLAEKRREDDIRCHVRAFTRWGTRELSTPRVIRDRLLAAGVPFAAGRGARLP